MILVILCILLCIYFISSKSNFPDIEQYRQKTNNFTFCEMGDLVGDDVQIINYKDFCIHYHTLEFSKKVIDKFAQECLSYGINTQYQLECCVRYKMYPLD